MRSVFITVLVDFRDPENADDVITNVNGCAECFYFQQYTVQAQRLTGAAEVPKSLQA